MQSLENKTKSMAPGPVESTVKQGRQDYKQSHYALSLKGAIIKARAEENVTNSVDI